MKKSSIRSQTSHIQVSEWQYQWVEALSCKHWRLHASFFYFSNYRMNLGEKWWQLPLSSRGWHIAWSSSQDMIRMSSSLSSLIAEISDISIGWVNWTLSIYHIEITTTKHTFCIYFPFMFFFYWYFMEITKHSTMWKDIITLNWIIWTDMHHGIYKRHCAMKLKIWT